MDCNKATDYEDSQESDEEQEKKEIPAVPPPRFRAPVKSKAKDPEKTETPSSTTSGDGVKTTKKARGPSKKIAPATEDEAEPKKADGETLENGDSVDKPATKPRAPKKKADGKTHENVEVEPAETPATNKQGDGETSEVVDSADKPAKKPRTSKKQAGGETPQRSLSGELGKKSRAPKKKAEGSPDGPPPKKEQKMSPEALKAIDNTFDDVLKMYEDDPKTVEIDEFAQHKPAARLNCSSPPALISAKISEEEDAEFSQEQD